MGLLNDGLNYVTNELEKSADRILTNYRRKLRTASDSVVLRKLDETEGEAYEITLKEARRRGLR